MIRLPNNGELYDFQENASNWILDFSVPGKRQNHLLLKAPTGSGKTIILLDYIDKYIDFYSRNTVFIWLSIGAGELEEQSKGKMDILLPERSSKTLSDALRSGFEPGDTVFINWESVTKKGNRALRIGELKNIKDRIATAHKQGLDFIVIIDEEHLNKTIKAQEFVDNFVASTIIRVSATAIQNESAYNYEIDESEVIDSGLITKAMMVNEGIDISYSDISSEYEYLIEKAINKRNEIGSEYEKRNKRIRPLILIQFPSSSEELVNLVENYLAEKGFSYENGFLSKWFSEEKNNIEDIEKNDAIPQILLCKQAISTGWDCPRAKILVKLRENMNETFETQTIGRIRRMPEARHYGSELLDNCYMYTFDEKYKEAILKEGNAYECIQVNLKEEAKSLYLTKEVRDREHANYGQREIRRIVRDYFVNSFDLTVSTNLSTKSKNKEKLDARSWVFGTKLSRIYLKGRFVKTSELAKAETHQQSIISYEVDTHKHGRDVMHIINELHGIISISDHAVRSILRTLFNESESNRVDNLVALDNLEWYAFIINNRNNLKEVFKEIKSREISQEFNSTQTSLNFFKNREFKIPLTEVYKISTVGDKSTLESKFEKNVYEGYQKNMVTDQTRSRVEQLFEHYCESSPNVKWYYKNGDKGDKYFSLAYRDGVGKIRLFYPDYILKTETDDTWIIETKGGERSGQTQNIDMMAETKFNAFLEYGYRHPGIKWGFVRDLNFQLYFNNQKYNEKMVGNSDWKLLSTIF